MDDLVEQTSERTPPAGRGDFDFRRVYHHRLYPLLLTFSYLTVVGVLVYLSDHIPTKKIPRVLEEWVPWNFRVELLFVLAGVLCCTQDMRDTIRSLWDRRGLALAVLLVVAFLFVCFVPPRTPRILFDEQIYGNVAQNIALVDRSGYCNYGTFEYGEYEPHWIRYNKQPSGWPFLVSLVFQAFGVNDLWMYLLNNLIFCFNLLLAFLITWRLTGSYFAGILAFLVLGLIPHHITWSNTGAAEPCAILAMGLVAFLLVSFLASDKTRHMYLLAAILPFACQIRTESLLAGIWVVLALVLLRPSTLTEKRFWTSGLAASVFMLPHLLHLYAFRNHSWGAQGAKFSLDYLWNNLQMNTSYYVSNGDFPAFFTLLFLLGIFWSRCPLRWRVALLGWFLMFWGIFICFYAGGYRYGADVRYALVSFMPLAVLAGMGGGLVWEMFAGLAGFVSGKGAGGGLWWGKPHPTLGVHGFSGGVVVLAILFSAMTFFPLVRTVGQEAWGSRYDVLFAKEFIKKIPRRSIVLGQNPNMFLLWGQGAIQTYAGVNNPGLMRHLMKKYEGHVYFHHNYWCNTQGPRNPRLCQAIHDKYLLEEVASAKEQDFVYALYRMRFRPEEAEPSP